MKTEGRTIQPNELVLAGRITIPSSTQALLWDMDGVLLDTLSLDYAIVNDLLSRYIVDPKEISADVIRSFFAYEAPRFWQELLSSIQVEASEVPFDDLVLAYDQIREAAVPSVHKGIVEILVAARKLGLRNAVVSNNPQTVVSAMLANVQLTDHFDELIGNDIPGLAKKPAPDFYLEATKKFGLPPSSCVVIEDSLLGAEAGSRAGCFTIGVATGGATLEELSQSPFVSVCYPSFSNVSEES